MDYGALVLAVRDEMAERFGRLSCINAVAALVDIGAAFGQQIRPLRVSALILNPRLTELVGDLQAASAMERLRQWANHEGCMAVALGVPSAGQPPGGDWAGHLVAVTDDEKPGRSLILDATLQQADRPAHGILLGPHILRVPSEHIDGTFHTRVNGCEILYQALAADEFHRSTPAWTDQSWRVRIRDGVLARLQPHDGERTA